MTRAPGRDRRWPIVVTLGLALLGLIGLDAASKAQTMPGLGHDMTVRVVRSHLPGCDPHCSEWIAMDGAIVEGSAALFRKVLRPLGARKLPVLINSPGGSTGDAMAIGRLVRAKGLDVVVSRTLIDACDPKACAGKEPTGQPWTGFAQCNSACPLILAGGVHREVPIDALVGLHQAVSHLRGQPAPAPGTGTPLPLASPFYRAMETYYRTMGVAADIMPLVKGTPPRNLHTMTATELAATRMATSTPNRWADRGIVAELYPRLLQPVVSPKLVNATVDLPKTTVASTSVAAIPIVAADPPAVPMPVASSTPDTGQSIVLLRDDGGVHRYYGVTHWAVDGPPEEAAYPTLMVTTSIAAAHLEVALHFGRSKDGGGAIRFHVTQDDASVWAVVTPLTRAPGSRSMQHLQNVTETRVDDDWVVTLPDNPPSLSRDVAALRTSEGLTLHMISDLGEDEWLTLSEAPGANLLGQFYSPWSDAPRS